MVYNEFNHKIYELKRSELYSPLTNLFVHNQKWGGTFFTNLLDPFEQVVETEKSNFRNLEGGMRDFCRNVLSGNYVTYKRSSKAIEKENLKANRKAVEIIKLMETKKKNI